MLTLEELMAMVLEIDPAQLNDRSSRTDISNWDSLAHLSVIAAVEEAYGVELSTAEMREASSVGSLRALLDMKRAGDG